VQSERECDCTRRCNARDQRAGRAASSPARLAFDSSSHRRSKRRADAPFAPTKKSPPQQQTPQSLARLFRPLTLWASQRYTAGVADKLKDYGLRYDDLYDPLMDADVAEALRRLPDEVVFARNARLRRAMDLSLKHEKLPKALRDRQTPFEQYLTVRLVLWVFFGGGERRSFARRGVCRFSTPSLFSCDNDNEDKINT